MRSMIRFGRHGEACQCVPKVASPTMNRSRPLITIPRRNAPVARARCGFWLVLEESHQSVPRPRVHRRVTVLRVSAVLLLVGRLQVQQCQWP